jgi:hypothetical protein
MGIFLSPAIEPHRDNYWTEDPDQKTEFPPNASVDEVVDRMIAILQDAAQ